MAYVGASELVTFMPQNLTFTASSSPLTLGEVDVILGEISAELDAAAARGGYLVPLAPAASGGATEAYQVMQRWTKLGAGAQVMGIIFPNLGGPGATNTLARDYLNAYNAALVGLAAGKIAIPGAPTDTGEISRELPRSWSTSNTGATVGVVPHFDTSTVF